MVGFSTTNFTRAWEPTLSWNQLHELRPLPRARKLAPTFVYSVAFARITAIRAAVVETSTP